MRKKLKASRIAKLATGTAFLFFCLFNLKTVITNNGNVEKSEAISSDEALARCIDNPIKNNGDCQTVNGWKICVDSWILHDCYY